MHNKETERRASAGYVVGDYAQKSLLPKWLVGVAASVLLPMLVLSIPMTQIGCAKNTTTPLPTGATNPMDAESFRVLSDAHAFLQSIGDSVRAGNLTLNATQKDAYNKLVASSNAADKLWQQYHAGNVTLAAQLTTATNNLQTSLSQTQAIIGVPAQ